MNTASSSVPDSAVVVDGIVNVVDVAPPIAVKDPAPGASENHYRGAPQLDGLEADALNVALPGAVTVRFAGCCSIDGASEHAGALTVNVTSCGCR